MRTGKKGAVMAVTVNDLLKEAQALLPEIESMEAEYARRKASAERARQRADDVSKDIYHMRAHTAKLFAAADVMQGTKPSYSDNWRNWPWVKEVGLDKAAKEAARYAEA